MIPIIIDIVMIFLLVITIGFCWKLNNKIIEIKGSRKDLVDLIKTLDNAIVKTNKNIADLKIMSSNSTVELQSYVEKARELLADLSFMTDTASHLADRIERGMTELRKSNDALSARSFSENIDNIISSHSNENSSHMADSAYSKTKQELLNRLQSIRDKNV